MYQLVVLLTKAVFTQMWVFLFTLSIASNTSALLKVVSLPFKFLKSGFLLLLLGFYIEMAAGIFKNRVLDISVAVKVRAVGQWFGGEGCWYSNAELDLDLEWYTRRNEPIQVLTGCLH